MTTVTRHQLSNGLAVLLEPMHDAPVVAMQAWVNVGAADEKPPHYGIAHLHEHMLFKGTQKRAVGQVARDVEAVGGEINAWTSFDQTVYHLVMAASETERGLDILSDVLTSSSFDKDELAREIEVVLEEIRRANDTPARRLSYALFGAMFPEHPYGRPVLGTEQSVSRMDRDAMLAFFHAHYRPDNTTLIIVGDFDRQVLLKKLEGYFGSWKAHSENAAKTPQQLKAVRTTQAPQSSFSLHVLREDVKETRASLAWPGPNLMHQDVAALDLLTTLLGHGEASRLHQRTVRTNAVLESYAYAYTPKDPGLISVGATLKPGAIQTGLRAVLDVVYRARDEMVTADELSWARTMLRSDAAYQRETVQGQANKLGFFELNAGNYRFENDYLKALEAVTPETIQKVARKYLTTTPTLILQVAKDESEAIEIKQMAQLNQAAATSAQAKPTQSQAITGPLDVITYSLENGATLLVRPEQGPVVAMRAVALGGQRWESKATAGLSTLFSSLWGVSTQSLSPVEMAAKVASLGGHLGAFGGRNTVGLKAEFIRENAQKGWALFLDALLHPNFSAEDFARERALMSERLRTRDDHPTAVAFEAFAAKLFGDHPYGLPVLGTQASLEAMSLADIEHYHQLFTAPENLLLCVAGAVDPQAIYATVAPLFQQHATHKIPNAPAPARAYKADGKQIRIPLARQQAHCIVGAQGTSLEHADRFAIDVMCAVLSGQSGRLFTDLRDVQSLAYTVSCSNTEGLDKGHILVYIGCAFDKVDQALRGVHQHLEKMREAPIGQDELQRAQHYLTGSHAIDLQRSGARAMSMALNARYSLGYDAYAHYPDKILAVTAADVQRVAKTYLDKTRLLEVVVGPEAA